MKETITMIAAVTAAIASTTTLILEIKNRKKQNMKVEYCCTTDFCEETNDDLDVKNPGEETEAASEETEENNN